MADKVFNEFKFGLLNGTYNLASGGNTITATLVMANTTVDTENDAIEDLADFTTLDVCDATAYAEVNLSTQTTSKVDANDEGKFNADDITFSAVNADASRALTGVLIFINNGSDATDKPICYLDTGFPITANGSDVVIILHADGLLNTE